MSQFNEVFMKLRELVNEIGDSKDLMDEHTIELIKTLCSQAYIKGYLNENQCEVILNIYDRHFKGGDINVED